MNKIELRITEKNKKRLQAIRTATNEIIKGTNVVNSLLLDIFYTNDRIQKEITTKYLVEEIGEPRARIAGTLGFTFYACDLVYLVLPNIKELTSKKYNPSTLVDAALDNFFDSDNDSKEPLTRKELLKMLAE